MSVFSIPARTEREYISLSALTDSIQEDVEIAYLVVQVSGTNGFAFADGSTLKTVEIRILDDNFTIGGTGHDTLRGTFATEDLIGGAGNDSYYLTVGDRVVEDANGGTDTVYSGASYVLTDNVEHLVLTGTAVDGIGNALANRITGNGAANLIHGRDGDDTLDGGAGNDTIDGGAGNDSLLGGAGNDRLIGNIGADTMAGGTGDDIYIITDRGNRVIEAANGGTDTVHSAISFTLTKHVEHLLLTGSAANGIGNAMANRITGNASANRLDGETGNDTVHGGGGNDRLIGQLGNDSLAGDAGNDLLTGGEGRDRLSGGIGKDTLDGGVGKDVLSGGKDADVFLFRSVNDSVTGKNRDIITDFSRGDRIELSRLDANSLQKGNQDFDFSGTTADANSVWYVKQADKIILRADTNGDTRADFEVTFEGIARLVESDFIF